MRLVEDRDAEGVRHRSFLHDGRAGEVPGALWTPLEADPVALVLIGHGASGSKYQDYVRSLGRRLAGESGTAALAIDGPVHGSRRPDKSGDGRRAFLDFAALWSSDPTATDRMVDDWRRSLDAVLALVGSELPVGYWGLSMGTIFGLPLVAAEKRVEACVLGLMGLTGPTAARIAEDAPKVTCPVLFLVQWADELFPKETAFDLFDAIGSTDKTLHANPGAHGAVPGHEFAASVHYLLEHLVGS